MIRDVGGEDSQGGEQGDRGAGRQEDRETGEQREQKDSSDSKRSRASIIRICGTRGVLQVLLHVRQLHRVGRQLLQTPQARRGLVSIATPTLALPPLQQPVLQPEHDLIAGQGEAQARLEQPEVDALQCQYPRRRHLVDGSDFQPQCWEVNTLEYLQHARTIQKLPVGWVCVDVVAVDRARSGLEVPRVEYQERQQVQRVRLLRVRLLLVTEVLL
mmetsp:Transcript_15322/g.33482  ORF Transcript_15322/g.33482 Transcript_15322/m.33482 type:complete len:215 (+) Transcript_15322:322-966(+)